MTTNREALSKKQRFDVFKRDLFSCQYCGRTPPAVVLEVDHITPVAKGGTNEPHNLITSCFDCNRGKATGSLEGIPLAVREKAALLAERLEQSKAYDRLLRQQRQRQDAAIADVIAVYQACFAGWTLKDDVRPSIRKFLEKLPRHEVLDAMESACHRTDRDRAFKYFCGICWKKIKQAEGLE